MRIKKILLIVSIIFIFLIPTACKEQQDESKALLGTYVTDNIVERTSSFLPYITFSDNNKFKLVLSINQSVSGVYNIDNNDFVILNFEDDIGQLILKKEDNNSLKISKNLPDKIAIIIKSEAKFTKISSL